MKSIPRFVLISAILTACTAPSIPHPTITPIHTSTAILADETRTPTRSVEATITPSPTKTVVPTPTANAEPTPTEPEPTPEAIVVENLNHIPIETVGCIDERLCSGIEVIDGETAMQEVYDTFANGPMFRKYWKSMGWNIPNGENAAEVFVDYLENSIGGPENKPYWVPVEDDGEPFTYLQGRSGVSVGYFYENTKVKEYGGFYLDKVGTVFIGVDDWKDKPEIREWFENNEIGKIHTTGEHSDGFNRDYIYSSGRATGSGSVFYGLVPFEGRFIFIAGAKGEVVGDKIYAKRNQLGVGDDPTDTEKIQAFWDCYFGFSKEWPDIPPGYNVKYRQMTLDIFPQKWKRGSSHYINVMGVDARLFVSTE
ncbi:MAG: hypothetical protein IMY85_00885 [Chloroflexi bacterium]|nr:hypothetical protein [Chloroflexota bacterium]